MVFVLQQSSMSTCGWRMALSRRSIRFQEENAQRLTSRNSHKYSNVEHRNWIVYRFNEFAHNFLIGQIKCYEPNHEWIHFISPNLSSYVIRLKASPQVFCAKAESTEFGLRTAFMVFKLLLLKISLVINKLDDVAVRVDGFLDCPNRKFAIHRADSTYRY